MYSCRIERHSISAHTGTELLTYVITFPRIVLAETVTHRMNSDTWGEGFSTCERTTTPDISKNSASSRAIPHDRFIQRINEDPYVPEWSGKAKGMQGSVVERSLMSDADKVWLDARDDMLDYAVALNDLGIHKQDSNRLLEPWAWVTQVVTSTEWDNFFALRCHHMAHPAFRKIARMMYLARLDSKPDVLEYGQWHLPFYDRQVEFRWESHRHKIHGVGGLQPPLLVSAARCAWVSYENHDKDASFDAVLRTCERLVGERPVHASPFEHQGTPGFPYEFAPESKISNFGSNFRNWIQLRKLIPLERTAHYNPPPAELGTWPEYHEWLATKSSPHSTPKS